MLRQLRRAAKTKFAGVIIGALVIAFALWGVSDIFRGTISDVVAEVGDTEITAVEFSRELRARMRQMGQQMNIDFTIEQARQFGMDTSVLDELVSRTALDEAVNARGLTASDDAVSQTIQGMAGFQGANGGFSYPLFTQSLAENGFTEADYIELIRKDIARSQMLGSVALGLTPPDGLTAMFHDFVNETRTVEYIVLTPEDADAIPVPTEEELAAFHAAHPELFNASEYRAVQYVVIGPDQVADQGQVTEEEIRQEFDNPQFPYNTPELRDIQQIIFPDQESAAAASARIMTEGLDFLTLAQERGLSADDIARGELTSEQLGGALAEAAFALPEGGVTAPVEGPFGWVLLRVSSITPGSERSFEDAQEEIRANLVRDRATVFMTDLANAFEDARAGGESIASAAASLNLPSQTLAAVDAGGLLPDGTPAPIPAEAVFIEQVFATLEGEESFLFQGDDGVYYAVGVDSITPETLRPLDTVRADVERAWNEEALANGVQKRATLLADEARMTSLEAVAGNLNREITTSIPLGRNAFDEVLGPDLLQQIFSVPQDEVLSGASSDGINYIVARIATVAHPVPDPASAEYTQFKESMAGQMAQDLIQALATASRAEAGATTYPATIETALTQGLFY